ncbi:hypothetical protein GWI33_022363 [Rhynchophorus ferrugineus]|uniref:Uncharacterized protein n=1 Tax=Rhynchophorus ferrugineus TaxID=354439 RepID=A0A834M4H1_RHYFE|nr:hypothetical protein GWI33_022364 [Rhynchophorus ferrugineus]KAF7264780.1 hypothetical protein GWI33_022363 [Rhynchophorus ferrugineus]
MIDDDLLVAGKGAAEGYNGSIVDFEGLNGIFRYRSAGDDTGRYRGLLRLINRIIGSLTSQTGDILFEFGGYKASELRLL